MTILARNNAAVLQDEDDKLPWNTNFEGRLAQRTQLRMLGCLLRNWYCIEPYSHLGKPPAQEEHQPTASHTILLPWCVESYILYCNVDEIVVQGRVRTKTTKRASRVLIER